VPPSVTRLLLGFVAGALAVLTFHQGMVWLLSALQLAQGSVYSTTPVPPFGVPRIANLCFWGGLYGAAFGLIWNHLPIPSWIAGICLGIVAALVGMFVVARIKGNPVANNWMPWPMTRSFLINAVWGLGVGLILPWLMPRRRSARVRS